jgi:hypothetical protein
MRLGLEYKRRGWEDGWLAVVVRVGEAFRGSENAQYRSC